MIKRSWRIIIWVKRRKSCWWGSLRIKQLTFKRLQRVKSKFLWKTWLRKKELNTFKTFWEKFYRLGFKTWETPAIWILVCKFFTKLENWKSIFKNTSLLKVGRSLNIYWQQPKDFLNSLITKDRVSLLKSSLHKWWAISPSSLRNRSMEILSSNKMRMSIFNFFV